MAKIIIGVTDCSKYDIYANWVAQDAGIEAIKLSHDENNFSDLEKCDGILLTGGEDVHTRFYNKPEYQKYCYPDDVNEKRDAFEFKVLEFSQKKSLPLLGICRGLQVANVFFGGTLIPDIPSFGKFNHSKKAGKDLYHPVDVDINSVFYQIVNSENGEVNSAHHQSAELVAPDLVSNAISKDGVIEGLEWKKPEGKPFMLLVQWHPERMINQQSAFTKNIREHFINAVKNS